MIRVFSPVSSCFERGPLRQPALGGHAVVLVRIASDPLLDEVGDRVAVGVLVPGVLERTWGGGGLGGRGLGGRGGGGPLAILFEAAASEGEQGEARRGEAPNRLSPHGRRGGSRRTSGGRRPDRRRSRSSANVNVVEVVLAESLVLVKMSQMVGGGVLTTSMRLDFGRASTSRYSSPCSDRTPEERRPGAGSRSSFEADDELRITEIGPRDLRALPPRLRALPRPHSGARAPHRAPAHLVQSTEGATSAPADRAARGAPGAPSARRASG